MKYRLLILAAVVCLIWYKIHLIQELAYEVDIFLHVQIAKSVFQGRGLFFDNVYAPASFIHSYFILILIGPFVLFTGVYGLILAHGAIYFASAVSAFSYLSARINNSVVACLSVFGLFFSFIPIWIWDDPTYGWHSELLFFPLGVLFFLSLSRKNIYWKILFGALLVLNREDGAVLACCLHLLHELQKYFSEEETITLKQLSLRIFLIIIFWFLLFLAVTGSIHYFGDGAEYRQKKAVRFISQMPDKPRFKNGFLKMITGTGILLSPLLVFYVVKGHRFLLLLATLFCLLPVLIISILASCAYLPKIPSMLYHGTSWPSRFNMLWCIVSAGALVSIGGRSRVSPKIGNFLIVCVVLISVTGQYFALKYVRGYPEKKKTTISLLRPKERTFISCLSKNLPLHITTAHTAKLGYYFHNHDWVFGRNVKHAWKYPEVFLCDANNRLHGDNGCIEALEQAVATKGYVEGSLKGLRYAYDVNSKSAKESFGICSLNIKGE